MQTSLVEVIVSIVRTQAVNSYMPLGALSASIQAHQLSYIWSLDFISAVTSSTFRGWRKVLFAVAIPLLVILVTLVGPSSAVLMIPRLGIPNQLEPWAWTPTLRGRESPFLTHITGL
jgi:F0F1-type ATP synthase assembly protein I